MKKNLWGYGLLGSVLLSSSVAAEVYRWSDRLGQKHYSDRPHREADIVNVRSGYTYHRVKRVFDGDTLLLANNQRVRLLGINTPEVEGRNKSAEPGGEEARRWLSETLAGNKVRLETDVEKKDKYGRLLAHVFSEQGRHLNIELVGRGLATVNIHPPNLRYSEQLLTAEANAYQAGLGLWRNTYYTARSFRDIRGTKGWKRVVGTVNKIKEGRRYVYLQFSDNFSIKIEKSARELFPDLNSYLGKKVEARGWLNKSKKRYSVHVRHPGNIVWNDK